MNKFNVTKVVADVRKTIVKHSPEILTGFGIAGMITTTVLAVKATPKALLHIEEAQNEKGDWLTTGEKVKACWKDYIPTAASGVFSVSCIIGANSVNARRNAAFATAYKLSETALNEYRDKVIETIGEKKEKTVREKVAKERLDKNPVSQNHIIITEKGNTPCLDPISGRYFNSDIERIKKAENMLNKRLLHDAFGYVSLNDFYDELGLEHSEMGDSLGWNVEKGLIDIEFCSQITDDGRPCIVLDYRVVPRYDYAY